MTCENSIEITDSPTIVEVENTNSTVEVECVDTAIEVIQGSVDILCVGLQGPQGTPGAGGAQTIVYNAGEPISGHKVVRMDSGLVYIADSSNDAHLGQAIGISTNAASIGNPVTVQTIGEITDASLVFSTPGPVFVGTNGAVTQTAPSTGWIQRVGTALDSDSLLINFETPFNIL